MHATRQSPASRFASEFPGRARLLLGLGLFVVIAQAFVPRDEFVHRSDDAFYYFGVAANFPEEGSWTFDRVHDTNGVQPLWAAILTAIAQVLSWVGITDRDVLARVFVALAACLLFASSMLLFALLRRTVSAGTGLVAAGAFLFPLGIVWTRTWGMESSLYAFLLLSSIAWFEIRFLRRPTIGYAVVLGALLGLTCLARLNAALLIPCLVGWMTLGPPGRVLTRKWLLGAIVSGVAVIPLLVYVALNRAATGHLVPISGAVKSLETKVYLRDNGIDGRLSLDFVATVFTDYYRWLGWFVESRLTDPFWIVGVRLVSDEALRPAIFVALVLAFALLPAALGRRAWFTFLGERYGRLWPFAYVLVFAVVDAAVSIAVYPVEIPYAMIRWWLVESEIVLVVLASTLVAAALGFVGERLVAERARLPLATAGVAAVAALSVAQTANFYWDGEADSRDWNRSYNEEMEEAASWMEQNLPDDALVGSWNAGVLGYYAKQRVVNLDGLINSYEIVPHLRQRTIPEYIVAEGIDYLSEVEVYIPDQRPEVAEELRLQKIYASDLPLLDTRYVIYKVLGKRGDPGS